MNHQPRSQERDENAERASIERCGDSSAHSRKQCTACYLWKPYSDFHYRPDVRIYKRRCKTCVAAGRNAKSAKIPPPIRLSGKVLELTMDKAVGSSGRLEDRWRGYTAEGFE